MSKRIIDLNTGESSYFKCNFHPRPLVGWSDLSDKARANFDYLDNDDRINDDARFFEYRGSWYDLYEFDHAKENGVVDSLGFEAVEGESAFSAVLAQRYGYEQVIVGYLHW